MGLLAPAITGTDIFDDVLNTIPTAKKSKYKKISNCLQSF